MWWLFELLLILFSPRQRPAFSFAAALVFLVIAAAILLPLIWGPTFTFILVAAAVLASTWWFLRYYNTRVRLHLSLVIETPTVAWSEPLRFKVKVEPNEILTVARMTAIFRCARGEQFRDDYGFPTYRSSEVAEEHRLVLAERETFRRGEIRYLDGEFLVPADAVATDRDGDLTARWYLRVEADLSFPPPAVVEEEVTVVRASLSAATPNDPRFTGDASHLFAGADPEPQSPPHPPALETSPSPAIPPPPPGRTTSFSHLEIERKPKKDSAPPHE